MLRPNGKKSSKQLIWIVLSSFLARGAAPLWLSTRRKPNCSACYCMIWNNQTLFWCQTCQSATCTEAGLQISSPSSSATAALQSLKATPTPAHFACCRHDTPDMNVATQNASNHNGMDRRIVVACVLHHSTAKASIQTIHVSPPSRSTPPSHDCAVHRAGLCACHWPHAAPLGKDPTIEVQHQVVLPPLVQFCLVGCWWATWRVIPEARDGRSWSPPTSN